MNKWLFTAVAALIVSQPSYAQTTISYNGPIAANSVPPSEVVGGTLGAAGTYMTAGTAQARITRATNCTLDSTGSCSVTWTTALSAAPNIVATPVNTAATQPISCTTTATPTTTAVSIKCWIVQTTALSLAIVTTGLTLAPAITAPSGTVVQIIAIPPTQ